MKERLIAIPASAGAMPAFVVHPEQDGPFPAVVLYMDFWGVREELYDIARLVAAVGYCCVVPDLYYRQGEVHNEIRDEHGRMISLSRLDETTRAKVLAPLRRLTDADAMEDSAALLALLAADPAVRGGAKGCFGYCLGGRLALRAAARFPDQIKASASLHGSALVSDREDSPHRAAHRIAGELYCGFAAHDPYTPQSTIAQLSTVMQSSAARYRYEVHPDTEHGYALPDRDIHDRKATLRDWELILAMFHRQIRGNITPPAAPS